MGYFIVFSYCLNVMSFCLFFKKTNCQASSFFSLEEKISPKRLALGRTVAHKLQEHEYFKENLSYESSCPFGPFFKATLDTHKLLDELGYSYARTFQEDDLGEMLKSFSDLDSYTIDAPYHRQFSLCLNL